MDDPKPSPHAGPHPATVGFHGHAFAPTSRSMKVAIAVGVVMVILALIGVGLTTTDRRLAPAYWVALVPVYALLCMGVAWKHARTIHGLNMSLVWRQLFHWLGIAVALVMDFSCSSGEETGMSTGLTALLLLALGCFLAGVHFERLFTIVGIVLAATLVVVVKAEQYMWLIFVLGGLAIFAMIAMHRVIDPWWDRMHSRSPADAPAR